jgi:DGQHR domain-containing protein
MWFAHFGGTSWRVASSFARRDCMADKQERAYLQPLVTKSAARIREAARRKPQYDTVLTAPSDTAAFEADGWKVDKKLKSRDRLRRPKAPDERLENKFWYLLYRLGYPELNQGRQFQILIERKGAVDSAKQIAVFGKDDETVIVAECKASGSPKKKSLQKDIEGFASLKGAIAGSIKKHYGADFKPKILWLFVTENVIWSSQDRARADQHNIRIITERELRYYVQIAEHLGWAGRFQFLAEFLKNQSIPGLEKTPVPAIRGKLGGRKFYAFVATPKLLLKLSFVNHRSLDDPDGIPSYQRLVSRTRMKQIGKFLTDGGFFPTNLLINFVRPVRFDLIQHDSVADVAWGKLYLPDRYQSAWIIDGQHRLYGFATIAESYLNQNLIVVAFEQLPPEEEANLFVTINHEQKSVPKTLLDDLQGELKWGSEIPSERIGAIAARLIGSLNADFGEPFYNRVTQQGIPATSRTSLTVPALKDGLRRSGLLGRTILKNLYELGPLSGRTDTETLDRARTALSAYFGLVRANNLAQWELGRDGFVCTNVAVQAYLQLLASLISYMQANKGLDPRELDPGEVMMEIEEYLEPILRFLAKADLGQMEQQFRVQFGSGGPREYYFRLCAIVREDFSDFTPDGLADWEAERSDENVREADRKLKEVNVAVQSYIFKKFKQTYGVTGDAYWDRGITDKEIKTRAYNKSLDDEAEKRLALENYLDFIDYKKIVENKQHWHLFAPVFDISMPGEKGYSKNLRWMDQINALRRIPAHPTAQRHYRLEDYDFINFIHEQLLLRLRRAEDEGND